MAPRRAQVEPDGDVARVEQLCGDGETIAATIGDEPEPRRGDALAIPDRVGRYLVLGKLGAGGMGVVFAAYDPDLDRKLAIKLLQDESGGDRTRLRLLREAQALARLSHPNVIQVYDVGTFGERVYIAMELVEGVPLGDWLAAEPRSLRAICAVFAQAGRGLEAAHARDLVHRDFKPDNVIVTPRGHAVVLDFGIAHAATRTDARELGRSESGVRDEPSLREPSLREPTSDLGARLDEPSLGASLSASLGASLSASLSMLDVELTRAGKLIGTPRYMAPEQFEGGETDARSDQFSFCVALWEAIHGQRPYPGDSVIEIWKALRVDGLREPSARRVPRSLQRALVRGLEIEPARRFASLAPLIAELERDRGAVWRRAGALTFVAASLGFGVWGLSDARDAEAPLCAGAEARLAAVWDADRRVELERAFAASGVPLAGQALPAALGGLDSYAADWIEMYTDACAATHLRGEQSAELLDLRMACLDERRAELVAAVEVLGDPDATVIDNSYEVVAGLRPLTSCADAEALAARVPAPDDPAVAAEVEQLHGELARSHARRDGGDPVRATAIARAAEARAAATSYAPIEAAARIELGLARMDAGAYDEAEATLAEGFYLALAVDHEAALDAALGLMEVCGDDQQRFEEGLRWARIADALLTHRGDAGSRARVAYESLLGVIHWRQGEFERSRDELVIALEHAEALGEDGQRLVWNVRSNLGSTLWSMGEAEDAAREFEAIVEQMQDALGPEHPAVASGLNNLASAHYSLGQHDRARAELERCVALYEGTYGPTHPEIARALNNLAVIYAVLGERERARGTHRRVIAIHEANYGPDHPELASSLSNLGWVLGEDGEHEAAVEHHRRAHQIRAAALGPEHTTTLHSLEGLGWSLVALGEVEDGLAALREVVEVRRRTLGEAHPSSVEALQRLGWELRKLGRLDEAEPALRTSLELREGADTPDLALVALSLGRLANLLVERGRMDEAAALLERLRPMTDGDEEVRALGLLDLARARAALGQPDAGLAAAREGLALLDGVSGAEAEELRVELKAWLAKAAGAGR